MDRIAALGGGIAIQHRMAFQGEYFRDRYGNATLKPELCTSLTSESAAVRLK